MQGAKRPTDLVVSTISMFILMLFNEKRKWTMQELAERLDIDLESVRKNIQALAAPKFRILLLQKKVMTLGDLAANSGVPASEDVEMMNSP